MADRLQAAKQGHISARVHSPSSSGRQHSPFRQNSPFAQPASAYHSAHLQQQPTHQNTNLRGMEMMAPGSVQQEQQQPTTISPKDALLDFHESPDDSNVPLFQSQPEAPQYSNITTTTMPTAPDFPAGMNFPPFNTTPADQVQHQYYLQQPQTNQLQLPQQEQQHPNGQSDLHQAPDFPTHIPSMESTNSDQNSSHGESTSSPNGSIKRPDVTSAESGTYSCTYHGCTQRFETPARLQKHKREAHRQTTPGSHATITSRDTTSTAGRGLSARNSQAGPHKCERINPATGKPCNSVFSRPYDLTRHEDTIHNARKQKVRCHLCTEEKTFSRNDALTRHMRVVHPEVSWPGKQKRRGRE